MPNLTDLIRVVPPDREEEVEDIYASAAYLIFPDDTRTNHGDPGSFLVYQSRRFGHIELSIADPEREDERQLFSHYLWNAGIKLAELVSDAETEGNVWSVEGHRVLELGAGVGLGGIAAILAGAEEAGISRGHPGSTTLDG